MQMELKLTSLRKMVLQVGQTVVSGEEASPEIGNAMPLSKIPLGTVISLYRIKTRSRSCNRSFSRNFAQLMARDGKYATIKMPSGETRLILLTCYGYNWSCF